MGKLSTSTLNFLKSLAKNNNRTWFNAHKDEYQKVKEEFEDFMESLSFEIAKFDPLVKKELRNSKTTKVFRIYRDVRFAKDKSPYKTNLGGYVSPGGMATGLPGYYVHIQPGNSFVGGGIHMPDAKLLGRVRDKVAKDYKKLSEIINDSGFKKHFKGLDQSKALKTAPKGFPKDHPAIEYLKLKDFTAGKFINDKDLVKSNFSESVLSAFKELRKLNGFFASVIK